MGLRCCKSSPDVQYLINSSVCGFHGVKEIVLLNIGKDSETLSFAETPHGMS